MPTQRTYTPGVKYHGNAQDRVHISAAIPLDIRARLEAESERSGESLSAVVRAALNSYTLQTKGEASR